MAVTVRRRSPCIPDWYTDSPASGSDEKEGEEAQTDNFTEPIRFEAGRIVL